MKELNFDHTPKAKVRIDGSNKKNPVYAREHYHKNKHKGASRARRAVAVAIKKGTLPSLKTNNIKCTLCGCRATVYDHRDYNKPLMVEPMCHSCNKLMGAAIPWLKKIKEWRVNMKAERSTNWNLPHIKMNTEWGWIRYDEWCNFLIEDWTKRNKKYRYFIKTKILPMGKCMAVFKRKKVGK